MTEWPGERPDDCLASAEETQRVAEAALAAVAAALPSAGQVAFQTGDDVGSAMLQYCIELLMPSAGPRTLAIVRPPGAGDCLASAWRSRQMRTRVLLTPAIDTTAAMATAAREAGCGVLLIGDVPTDVSATGIADGGGAEDVATRRPFLDADFASMLRSVVHPESVLEGARTELARRVFDPPR